MRDSGCMGPMGKEKREGSLNKHMVEALYKLPRTVE